MSVAVDKIEGVESAKVSLNQGLVAIELKPGNSVSLEQIRKAITDQAFTPKAAKIAAVGDLISSNGKLEFRVSGSKDVYDVALTPHASWNNQVGKEVKLSGVVSGFKGKQKESTIQITQVDLNNNRK